MILKYWPILIFVSVMFVSCGLKKEKTFVDVPGPYALPQCSSEERAEVTRKATTEYPFVILPKLDGFYNDAYCDEIRTLMKAIDLLPPKVRDEYERAKKKHGLKVYVARESVLEYDDIGPGIPAADGYYNGDLEKPFIVIAEY